MIYSSPVNKLSSPSLPWSSKLRLSFDSTLAKELQKHKMCLQLFIELQLCLLQVSSIGSEDLERDRRIMRVLLAVNCLKSGKS